MKLGTGSSDVACVAVNFGLSTHTKEQSSVGLSVPGTKHQGPLAGMHIPTAAVGRPAQRSIIGIIGA